MAVTSVSLLTSVITRFSVFLYTIGLVGGVHPFLGLSTGVFQGSCTSRSPYRDRSFFAVAKNVRAVWIVLRGWLSISRCHCRSRARGCGRAESGNSNLLPRVYRPRARSSNWLHRRFYRVVLPWPLETTGGVPCGRGGWDEGGLAAPTRLTVSLTYLISLVSGVIGFCSSRATFAWTGRRIGRRWEPT